MPRPEPTRKAPLAGLAIASLAVLVLLGRGGPVASAGLVVLMLIFVASYAEAVRAGREIYRVRVEREAPRTLGEGTAGEIVLRALYTGDDPPSYLVIRDHADRRLRPQGETGRLGLRPGEWTTMSYTVRPAPGLSKMRAITLASGDPLGLFRVSRMISLSTAVIVSPSYLPVQELAGGRSRGAAEAVVAFARGASPEFYQLREYQPGDDVRMIHWPTSARMGVPIVREGPETVVDDIALLIDLSAPTWPGTPGEAAADWIMRTALYIARAVARAGGRVWAYILRGEFWEEWPALRGQDAVAMLSSRLARQGPDTAERRLGLERAVSRLLDAAPRGAWFVLLLGPTVSHRGLVRVLAEGGVPGCRILVGQFVPLGDTAMERLVRSVERRHYERARREYERLGVRSVLANTPGGVAWVASEAVRLPLSRSC